MSYSTGTTENQAAKRSRSPFRVFGRRVAERVEEYTENRREESSVRKKAYKQGRREGLLKGARAKGLEEGWKAGAARHSGLLGKVGGFITSHPMDTGSVGAGFGLGSSKAGHRATPRGGSGKYAIVGGKAYPVAGATRPKRGKKRRSEDDDLMSALAF